jgi:hypothetical protein
MQTHFVAGNAAIIVQRAGEWIEDGIKSGFSLPLF